nr:MAG TPA: hypothetical protein [Caudoviricetes sp.]
MRRVDRSARGLCNSPTIFPNFPTFKIPSGIRWI